MSMQLALIGDLLMVSEGDLGPSERREVAMATGRMLAAFRAGRISEAEFVDWVCLRVAVAERLGGATS